MDAAERRKEENVATIVLLDEDGQAFREIRE